MKKTYEKPHIFFDSFELTTNISAGCEHRTHLPGEGWCGLDFSGLMVFMEGMTGCADIKIGAGGSFDGICYQTPTGDNNLFAS